MRTSTAVLGALVLLAGQAVAKLTSCYQPNGTLFPNDKPCNPDDAASMCCAKGWTCLSDGVCQVNIENQDYYYRGTCTDKSWNADQCLSRCLNFNSNESWALGKCRIAGQDSYCCSGDSNCDCGTGQGVFNLGDLNVSTVTVIGSSTWKQTGTASPQVTISVFNTAKTSTHTTSSVTSLASGASVLSVPTTAQPTASPSPSSGSSSNATALGAGLGVGLGVPLVAAVVLLFVLLRRRKQRQNQHPPAHPDDEKKDHFGSAYHSGSPNTPFVEADGSPDVAPVEAQGDVPYRPKEYAHQQQQVPLVEAEGDSTYREH